VVVGSVDRGDFMVFGVAEVCGGARRASGECAGAGL
jgi:hypothetical protein